MTESRRRVPGRGAAHAQAIVEFALVLPLLLLLGVVVWDGGSVLREQVILNGAARSGARVAASGYGSVPLATVQNAVLGSAADLDLPSTPGYLSVDSPDPRSVRVTVRRNHELYTPLLRQLWGGGSGVLALESQAVFYAPQETPVPATVSPSTATPTATPTPSPTPTFTPTPLPTATPTPLPASTPTPAATATPTLPPVTCVVPVVVPDLLDNQGFYVIIQTAAPGRIIAAWNTGNSGDLVRIYAGNVFPGSPPPPNPSTRTPGSLGTAIASGNGSPRLAVTSVRPAGTYTVYFFNRSGEVGPSNATIVYQKAGCP